MCNLNTAEYHNSFEVCSVVTVGAAFVAAVILLKAVIFENNTRLMVHPAALINVDCANLVQERPELQNNDDL